MSMALMIENENSTVFFFFFNAFVSLDCREKKKIAAIASVCNCKVCAMIHVNFVENAFFFFFALVFIASAVLRV